MHRASADRMWEGREVGGKRGAAHRIRQTESDRDKEDREHRALRTRTDCLA